MSESKNMSESKFHISIYKPDNTWIFGHKDLRRNEDILRNIGWDSGYSYCVDKEIKKSGFNLKDPCLIGKIVECWSEKHNGTQKRVCKIIHDDNNF